MTDRDTQFDRPVEELPGMWTINVYPGEIVNFTDLGQLINLVVRHVEALERRVADLEAGRGV